MQERLQRKIKAGKYRKHSFLFGGGLTACGECGRAVTWELQKGHHYGHCTKHNTNCTQKKFIREETVEAEVLNTLESFKIVNTRLLEWVRKALKEIHKDESQYHEDIVKELDDKYLKIKKRLDVIYDDKVDGLISKEQYELKRDQYEEELNSILDAKEKHAGANISYHRLAINIFELAQKGKEIYQEMKLQQDRRELLNFVFSNLKIKDGKVAPTLQNGFGLVAARAQGGDWLRS